MKNRQKCPQEEWDGYNEEEKRIWSQLVKVLRCTDYLPAGLYIGQGYHSKVAQAIAKRVINVLRGVKGGLV